MTTDTRPTTAPKRRRLNVGPLFLGASILFLIGALAYAHLGRSPEVPPVPSGPITYGQPVNLTAPDGGEATGHAYCQGGHTGLVLDVTGIRSTATFEFVQPSTGTGLGGSLDVDPQRDGHGRAQLVVPVTDLAPGPADVTVYRAGQPDITGHLTVPACTK